MKIVPQLVRPVGLRQAFNKGPKQFVDFLSMLQGKHKPHGFPSEYRMFLETCISTSYEAFLFLDRIPREKHTKLYVHWLKEKPPLFKE